MEASMELLDIAMTNKKVLTTPATTITTHVTTPVMTDVVTENPIPSSSVRTDDNYDDFFSPPLRHQTPLPHPSHPVLHRSYSSPTDTSPFSPPYGYPTHLDYHYRFSRSPSSSSLSSLYSHSNCLEVCKSIPLLRS